MNKANVFYYRIKGILNTFVEIGIVAGDNSITEVFFGHGSRDGFMVAETPLIKKAASQIGEYLNGKRRDFSLPLAPRGTEFQMAVWQALRTIPYGETRSYREIAVLIGRPKAVRAVGMANHRNPISVIVPCHRVIGSSGDLTGYGGGLPLKRYLLELEFSFSGLPAGSGKAQTKLTK